jgi:hypothetical protein
MSDNIGCRLEMETQISGLQAQIAQERDSNKEKLQELRCCMKAENDRAMKHCESGAMQAIRDAQQVTGKLQAEVIEKSTEISKLISE